MNSKRDLSQDELELQKRMMYFSPKLDTIQYDFIRGERGLELFTFSGTLNISGDLKYSVHTCNHLVIHQNLTFNNFPREATSVKVCTLYLPRGELKNLLPLEVLGLSIAAPLDYSLAIEKLKFKTDFSTGLNELVVSKNSTAFFTLLRHPTLLTLEIYEDKTSWLAMTVAEAFSLKREGKLGQAALLLQERFFEMNYEDHL